MHINNRLLDQTEHEIQTIEAISNQLQKPTNTAKTNVHAECDRSHTNSVSIRLIFCV